jgi:hypothetical protein
MLAADFAVNTDARSVLFCSDWSLLADGAPFGRWRGGCDWRAGLPGSFEAAAAEDEMDVLEWLDGERRRIDLEVGTVALESMPDWEITGDGIVRRADGQALIRAYAVEASSREVGSWDQPFYLGGQVEEVVQLCQQRDGVLRFLVRASIEAGFRERVQVGPSWQSDDLAGGEPPARLIAESIRRGRERMATLQSDEGGRFFRSVCRYRIVEVPPDCDLPWRHAIACMADPRTDLATVELSRACSPTRRAASFRCCWPKSEQHRPRVGPPVIERSGPARP